MDSFIEVFWTFVSIVYLLMPLAVIYLASQLENVFARLSDLERLMSFHEMNMRSLSRSNIRLGNAIDQIEEDIERLSPKAKPGKDLNQAQEVTRGSEFFPDTVTLE